MARLSLEEIQAAIGAEFFGAESQAMISNLLLDSRKALNPEESLYFALKGQNHDGHFYIKNLIAKGYRSFVVEDVPESVPKDCKFLKVQDSLRALQELAGYVRRNSNAKVIGVTGSNAKTIVKEWIFQLLSEQFQVSKNPMSYNSQVGVPLSVWRLDPNAEIGIFEAGISQPGEMQFLQKIIEPNIGLFTNLGSAHDANFSTRHEKLEEKLKLFKGCKSIIFSNDQKEVSARLKEFAESHEIKPVTWSVLDQQADLFVRSITKHNGSSQIMLKYESREFELNLPFIDDSSIENGLHACLAALHVGLGVEELVDRIPNLEPIAMRLEMKSGRQGNLLVNDVYNSDFESLSAALSFLDQQAGKRKKVLILSDILQSGLPFDRLYFEVEKIVESHGVQQLITIGEESLKYQWKNVNVDSFSSSSEFLNQIYQYNFKDSALLLKGARAFEFEKISAWFEEKSHQTVLEIRLENVVHNLNYFRAKLKAETKVMAMVKAFSYGSGAYQIASLLEFHQVDYLAVAYADEGVELRQAGVTLPIMVLNAESASFSDLLQYRLEPEIYNLDQLKELVKLLNLESKNDFPIHLKLETGMKRLGFEANELEELISFLNINQSVRVASVFSHLAAADDQNMRNFSLLQMERFSEMLQSLKQELSYEFLSHILNSAGISSFDPNSYDMVRLGIGLYGVSSIEDEKETLKPVSALKAHVSQIKKVKPGESVGYSRSFVATQETRIAIISIGYADGFRRSLGNGIGEVLIGSKRYKVVGNVCMDMLMVDIGEGNVEVGDSVEIFGDTISIYEIAEKMNTIPYEVLTSVSQRVKRVYMME